MDRHAHHLRIWRLFQPLLARIVARRFALSFEPFPAVDGPVLLIPNHSCTLDPLLVASCLGRKQVYFVASEHIFRLGLLSRLIRWLVAPIPRSKGASGADTVKSCLRHLRAGHSVCLFAEGEQCWDGRSTHVFASTGKLARRSGATLVTYRIEGGYFSMPRWGKGIRRGRVHGAAVGVYPPEVLARMSPEEIDAAIERDIRTDAFAAQRESPVAYRGKRRAEGMEKLLCLCPRCRRVGTLSTEDDRLRCACGLETRFTEEGFFDPPDPFDTLAAWSDWQRDALRRRDFAAPEGADAPLFADDGVRLTRIGADHVGEVLGEGRLALYPDRLACAGQEFPLASLGNPAMVQSHLLLFGSGADYYELHALHGANLKKYLDLLTAPQA